MPELTTANGLGVLHLFAMVTPDTDLEAASALLKAFNQDDQAVPFVVLGHKADLGVMALSSDLGRLQRLQTNLRAAGLHFVDSYVSLTEISEYAPADMSDSMKRPRLYPQLPPEGKKAICFYPMSKRRSPEQNWYEQDFDTRKQMMMDHGKSGMRFSGRIVQLVTGSTGLDDWEWGVTLFGERPDDLKECVYLMRFDEVSVKYAEFGEFITGIVIDPDELVSSLA